MVLRDFLVRLQKNNFLTQSELAKKLEISQASLSRYMNNKRRPTYANTIKILAKAGYDLDGSYIKGKEPGLKATTVVDEVNLVFHTGKFFPQESGKLIIAKEKSLNIEGEQTNCWDVGYKHKGRFFYSNFNLLDRTAEGGSFNKNNFSEIIEKWAYLDDTGRS